MKSARDSSTRKIVKKKFTQDEDTQLVALVTRFGEKCFKKISKFMPGRNARQCRERWKYYLQPQMKNEEWSEDEDSELKRLFNIYGPQWSQIANFFANRSSINVRNRFRTITRRERKCGTSSYVLKLNKSLFQGINEMVDTEQTCHILIEIPLPISRLRHIIH